MSTAATGVSGAWAPATPALRPFVGGYSGYHQDDDVPGDHIGLPSPWLTVVITLDDPLVVTAHPDPAQPGGRYDALVGGLHLRPARIVHHGRQSGVQIALGPLGSRALLGVPGGALVGTDVDLADIVGSRFVEDLRGDLRAAPDWAMRFAVLDRALLERLDPGKEVLDGTAPAWRALLGTAGSARVGALADSGGWGERRLRTRFREEIGLSPKEAARVVRFDRARRLLTRRSVRAGGPGRLRDLRLAALAAACGYYDQAHLAREFRALSGLAPSAWIAAEFRNVQATVAP